MQERARKENEKAAKNRAEKGDFSEDNSGGSDDDESAEAPAPQAVRARPTLNMGSLASAAQSNIKKTKGQTHSKKSSTKKGGPVEEEGGVGNQDLDPEMARVNQQLGGGNAGCLVKLSVERALRGEKIGVAKTHANFDVLGKFFFHASKPPT